jgi:iron complex outermembrane recepter protein
MCYGSEFIATAVQKWLAQVRTFLEPGKAMPARGWLKDTRVSINVTNLFNDRQAITDSSGGTPLRYQRAYRDPLGRTIELQLRKAF